MSKDEKTTMKCNVNHTFVDGRGNKMGEEIPAFIMNEKGELQNGDDGQPLLVIKKDKSKALTLRQVVSRSMLAHEDKLDQDKKAERFSLWRKIDGADKTVDLTVAEKNLIIEVCYKFEPTLIAGQVEEHMNK